MSRGASGVPSPGGFAVLHGAAAARRSSRARRALACAVAVLAGMLPLESAAARLGPFVKRLAEVYDREGESGAAPRAARRGLRLRSERGVRLVPVILEPRPGLRAEQIARPRLRALGGRVDAVSPSFVRVLVPFSRLRRLAEHPDVRLVRAPTPARALGGFGSLVSESVALTGAEELQAGGLTGAGIDVAVVDLGFIGLGAAIAAGEIPADAVSVNLPGSCDLQLEADTEHGVGVAEHLIDMAPGAALHLIKVCDELDLENAAGYLADNGVRVANHSVGWVNASYYDDTGPISAIVNDSRDLDGVFWSVAAGNDAQAHWRGGWSDADADDWLDWSGADETNDLSASSEVCLFLNWDQYGSSDTDLDLYVLDQSLAIVAASAAVQNGPQDPSEAVCFSYDPAEAPYGVSVHLWSGPTAGLDLTLFSFYNDLEYAVAEASLMDPAAAHGAHSVGAIYRGSFDQPDPPPEPYSSQGPTTDGRIKPDLCAPDGTTSWTYGLWSSFGTSFAAPTVAGAAALLLEDDPGLAPTDLALALSDLAIDLGTPGTDPVCGAGKLHLDIAPACGTDPDTDADGVCDPADNCLEVSNPDQRDTDADGYGNLCDADYDNNSAADDVGALKRAFGHAQGEPEYDPDVDHDGDGVIGGSDVAIFRALFFLPPGPSGLSCAGTIPCPAP